MFQDILVCIVVLPLQFLDTDSKNSSIVMVLLMSPHDVYPFYKYSTNLFYSKNEEKTIQRNAFSTHRAVNIFRLYAWL